MTSMLDAKDSPRKLISSLVSSYEECGDGSVQDRSGTPILPLQRTHSFADALHSDIISRVHKEYDRKGGILDIMSHISYSTNTLPRDKINVLVIGNHSSGKSSFINWYVGDMIQKESAAMETAGFAVVTSGEKRDTFEGAATLRHVPMLQGAEQFPGLMENLTTEICTSTARDFSYVNFIDSPGLTDANLQYPFDINDVLLWMSARVDLILVFFDPHGQATCARTNDVIRRLEQTEQRTRVHYFLTKADLVPDEKERMKVISQLTQTLSRASHASDKTYGGKYSLDIKPIFRPLSSSSSSSSLNHKPTPNTTTNKTPSKHDYSYNQIDELLSLISDSISRNVQRHIKLLEDHCKILSSELESSIEQHYQNQNRNGKINAVSWLMWCLALLLPLIVIFNTSYFINRIMQDPLDAIQSLFHSITFEWMLFCVLAPPLFYLLMFLSKMILTYRKEVTDENLQKLTSYQRHIAQLLGRRGIVEQLWETYMKDKIGQDPSE